MKNSFFTCSLVLAAFALICPVDAMAQNIEVGQVHQDCMWFTCYKSRPQSNTQGGNEYWDYFAEFNRLDDNCDGYHFHGLPDFIELDGLKYRVSTAFTLPWSVPNRMVEKLHFSAYNHLTRLFIPEESQLMVGNLPNVDKFKYDGAGQIGGLYAPKLKSLCCDGSSKVMSRGMSMDENLNDTEWTILRQHEGFNHLRVACVVPSRWGQGSLNMIFEDCPELSTLVLAYPTPPEFHEWMFSYNDDFCQKDESGRRFYAHPMEEHVGPLDHCTLARPNEKVYVVEIPEKTLVVPVGSLEKYKNAPGWSDFGTIVEGVDFEGIPLVPAWKERSMHFGSLSMDGKASWIHEDEWKDWALLIDETEIQLEDLLWEDAQYFVQNGIIYVENFRGEAEIVGPSDPSSSSYSFSDYVENNGKRIPVTKIRGYAFADFKYLNNNPIPSTVREIGNYAFYNAEFDRTLASYANAVPISVDFENIEKVGRYAFAECAIDPHWTEGYINSYPAQPCIEWIGAGAFSETSFYHYGDYAWNLILPKSVRHIGRDAFCNGLQTGRPRSIKLPENLDYTGINAFEWGANLDLCDYNRDFGDYVAGTIPYGLFGDNGYVSSISSIYPANPIDIPETVRVIEGRNGENADSRYARSSAKITIGSNVESIQPYAFTLKPDEKGECRIYVHAQNPPMVWEESFVRQADKIFDVEIHVPVNSKSDYARAGWQEIGTVIDDIDIREIESDSFTFVLDMVHNTATLLHTDIEKYRNLNGQSATLQIPGTIQHEGEDYAVTAIGSWATGEPTEYHAWSTIVLPETVENIEAYAFPFTFSSFGRDHKLICLASTPPNIETEDAFGWPCPVDRFTSSHDKCGDLYVKDDALDAYADNKQFNTLFRIATWSDFLTGTSPVVDSGMDETHPIGIYTIDGLLLRSGVNDIHSLPGGLYILRQGDKSVKIMR